MSERFLSSDEYDEKAHQLYNEGRYDDALDILKEGATLYPNASELQVGMAYAYLAREEYAWARRHFEAALTLDVDHEDALAGYGEVLLKLGDESAAIRSYERILELGFQDDHELMLQLGRALFREGYIGHAHRFFGFGVAAHPESAEATACVGYASHRMGRDSIALYWLRRALELDPHYSEARIYLANMLYDRGESEASLYHLERTRPDEHYDELGLWRYIELKRSIYRMPEDDPELYPWLGRLSEITSEHDPIDVVLAEIEAQQLDGGIRDPNQLELFSALVADLPGMQQRRSGHGESHLVATLSGHLFNGTWDEILVSMKEANGEWVGASLREFMADLAKRGQAETGVVIPVTDAEAFIRGSAEAGVLRIIQ
jgi:tetratricopeptide (TPR) repeat protein